jgi:hypothetical protein
MLASPRGFSQLATSFFAYLRQGIPTHALSSLTIKLTPHTEYPAFTLDALSIIFTLAQVFPLKQLQTCLCYPSDIQLSNTHYYFEVLPKQHSTCLSAGQKNRLRVAFAVLLFGGPGWT